MRPTLDRGAPGHAQGGAQVRWDGGAPDPVGSTRPFGNAG